MGQLYWLFVLLLQTFGSSPHSPLLSKPCFLRELRGKQSARASPAQTKRCECSTFSCLTRFLQTTERKIQSEHFVSATISLTAAISCFSSQMSVNCLLLVARGNRTRLCVIATRRQRETQERAAAGCLRLTLTLEGALSDFYPS